MKKQAEFQSIYDYIKITDPNVKLHIIWEVYCDINDIDYDDECEEFDEWANNL